MLVGNFGIQLRDLCTECLLALIQCTNVVFGCFMTRGRSGGENMAGRLIWAMQNNHVPFVRFC